MTLEKPRFLERCPGFDSGQMEPNRTIRIVRKGQMDFLTDKQVLDYYEHRKKFLTWLIIVPPEPHGPCHRPDRLFCLPVTRRFASGGTGTMGP